jgi:alcohol dehydrogenase class IV
VLRFLAERMPERVAMLGVATGSGDAAGDIQRLIASLGLPQHAADYGIGEPELRRAASELGGKYPSAELLGVYLEAL